METKMYLWKMHSNILIRITLLLSAVIHGSMSEVVRTYACPGKELHLFCSSPGQRIVVHEAYYGHDSPASCDIAADSPDGKTCVHPDPLGALARSCFGKNECKISPFDKAEVFNFLDPCPGLERYISVSYNCAEDSSILSICDTSNAVIERPLRGYVISQNYPDLYYNGRSCKRTLRGLDGQVISIDVLDLDLEYSEITKQCYDFVVFHQSKIGSSAKTYCGTRDAAKDLNIRYPLDKDNDNEIMVSFESSIEDRHRGFLFQYEVTGCSRLSLPPTPYNGMKVSVNGSHSVQYRCRDGYELLSRTRGLVTCRGTNWVGDAGFCLKIDTTTTSTSTTTSRTTPTTITSTTSTTTSTTATTTTTTRKVRSTTTVPSSTIASTRMSTKWTTRISSTANIPVETQPSTQTEERTTPTSTKSPKDGNGSAGKENENEKPVWSMHPTGNDTEDTKKQGVIGPKKSETEDDNTILLAAIAGGVGLVAITAFVVAVICVRRYRAQTKLKQKQKGRSSGLSSLRPSSHACVSIPNTYAGVGYAAAKSASYSSSSERNSIIAASSSARNSSSRTSSNLRNSSTSDEISYESDIYERAHAESLKGSADPILTNSETSFDCVEVKMTTKVPAPIPAKPNKTPTADVETTYLKPVAYTTNSQMPLITDSLDSDLLYPMARPSLETIREEHEGDGNLLRATPTPLPTEFPAPEPEDSCSSFHFQRQDGDGVSNPGYQNTEEETSQRSIDSDIKPKVEMRRIRTRPISMGEADQPESKRRLQKVEYALFKDDDTGNLDNFLDQRRVSV